jgi:predicted component of type VI protein secretion system
MLNLPSPSVPLDERLAATGGSTRTRGAPAPFAGQLTLVVQCTGGVFVHPLPMQGSVTIGRSRSCRIRIPDESVSRQHLVIHVGESVEVEDCGSRNGVRMQGTSISVGVRHALPIGACLELGTATVWVTRDGNASAADRKAAERTSLDAIVRASERTEVMDPRAAEAHRQADGAAHPSAESKSARAGLVVADPTMRRLYDLLDVVAASDISVLVLGETGVGKEIVSEYVHRASPRRAAPYDR